MSITLTELTMGLKPLSSSVDIFGQALGKRWVTARIPADILRLPADIILTELTTRQHKHLIAKERLRSGELGKRHNIQQPCSYCVDITFTLIRSTKKIFQCNHLLSNYVKKNRPDKRWITFCIPLVSLLSIDIILTRFSVDFTYDIHHMSMSSKRVVGEVNAPITYYNKEVNRN